MSPDRQRWHVPTSDELEQQGAISPASQDSGERRKGLRRFFRAGRFRVSDDVAAKKHVGTVPDTPAPGSASPISAPPERPKQAQPTEEISDQRHARRAIRIDQSVKDRRGTGRDPGS
jgi:hypothetical protein